MPSPKSCPKCNAIIPANAPAGICPSCLLNAGLSQESRNAIESTSAAGTRFIPPAPDKLSSQLPHLEVFELVGRGGMGAVYRARHLDLDRIVALKILPSEIGEEAAFAERFAREARALAKLNHPNIVSVFDFGELNDQCYFLMEFIDGTNLRAVIESKQIEPHEALDIVRQVCDALEYAHSQGVVHRDIKPENILVNKTGQVKIADFGLAKLLGDNVEESLTATQQVMGSLRYMAPEQSRGTKLVDHRADIFSLGVVFYELLTGDLPIGRFQLPSEKAATDSRLDGVVLRALENEPDQRYQNASEVNHDIESIAKQPMMAPRAPVKSFTNLEPRDSKISQKAVVGAAWILFFIVGMAAMSFLVMLLSFSQTSMVYQESSASAPAATSQLSFAGIVFSVIALAFFLIGAASLIGTPILGFAAVKDIKNSRGRIYGMRLAVFDVVFYPLVVIDLLVCIFVFNLSDPADPRGLSMLAVTQALTLSLIIDVSLYIWALHWAKRVDRNGPAPG